MTSSGTRKTQRSRVEGRRPVAVDLFAGAGGLSLGFEQAGFDVLATVEYDAIAAAVHTFNFPRTEVVCADAATVLAEDVRAACRRSWGAHREGDWDGVIDIAVGGPPCQGFSLIGKRAFDDPRNQLVKEFVRLVGTLQPRYFVMENVPGMRSARASKRKGAHSLVDLHIEQLRGYGYEVLEPQVFNAREFGVPQDRQRLIVIGHLKNQSAATFPTPLTRGRTRQGTVVAGEAEERPLCPSVWDAIRDLPNPDDREELLRSDELELHDSEVAAMHGSATPYVRRLRGLDNDAHDLSWPRNWRPSLLTSSLRTIHEEAVVKRFAETMTGEAEPVSRLFRLHKAAVSSTLRAGTHYERGSFNAPRPIHPVHARVITVREAARLHSYPDWFRFNWTKWHGFREIGNSLPPLVGRAVGAAIMTALGREVRRPEWTLELGDRELLYMDTTEAIAHFDADVDRVPRHALRWRKPKTKLPAGAASAP